MAAYRKKPVEIEAVNVKEALAAAKREWHALPDWLQDAYAQGDVIFRDGIVTLKTLEGWLDYEEDYWLIRGVKGELYGCADDVFKLTYDLVE